MFSYCHENYKDTPAYNAATAMPVILENGRKVFGPPTQFNGSPPTHICELYITRIPPQLDELAFLVWLHRIGQVYAFRLMMDTGNTTRGYGFVRFCSENDALAAFELLKHLFVDGERLSVFRSYGKSRLFINGIPRQLPLTSLENGFKLCFPNMKGFTAYPIKHNKLMSVREDEKNRGFAFIEFEDHEKALFAKKKLTPGRIRMWGADLKVQWAKPKDDMRNTVTPNKLPGKRVPMGFRVYPHFHQPIDYCVKLRLYCLANNLCIPVVLYGPSFRSDQIQYAGILLTNNFVGCYSYFIFELMVAKLYDIHLLMCEVAVKMIEKYNGQLQYNAVFRVMNETKAELVYNFKSYEELRYLNIQNHFKYEKVVTELATSLQMLALQNPEQLFLIYKRSFLTYQPVATFCLDINNPKTQFYAVLPKFRNNAKLSNNFNDFEITLLQMSPKQKDLSPSVVTQLQQQLINNFTLYNRDGVIMLPIPPQQMQKKSKQMKELPCFTLKSQYGGYNTKYILRYVDIIDGQLRKCYHSAQRVNSNPIWIAGQSYQKSIYN